jgi:hypothetical protein
MCTRRDRTKTGITQAAAAALALEYYRRYKWKVLMQTSAKYMAERAIGSVTGEKGCNVFKNPSAFNGKH